MKYNTKYASEIRSRNNLEKNVNILVWPSFSVVGIEIAEQLRFMKGIKLYGAADIIDHPLSEIYSEVIEVPKLNGEERKLDLDLLKQFVIFPAHDYVLDYLAIHSFDLSWIGSSSETISLTRNKARVYEKIRETKLSNYCPKIYSIEEIANIEFPVYIKPNLGFGSQGHLIVQSLAEFSVMQQKLENSVLMEVLQGDEFTIDCFTDRLGILIYSLARKRSRIRMGTSLSFASPDNFLTNEFSYLANLINQEFKLNGPWYFQVKAKFEDSNEFKILEISTRLAGSSVWARAKGVNLAEIAVWNYRNIDVRAIENSNSIILERDLSTKLTLNLIFNHIYIDLDDTILIEGQVNHWAIAFIIQESNKGKKIHLLTKSLEEDLLNLLIKTGLNNFFTTVTHLKITEEKSDFVKNLDCIFIDDSFSERSRMKEKHQIACFGTEIFQLLVK